MSIPFQCKSCSAHLKAADGTTGKKTRCLVCDAVNIVPAPVSDTEAIAEPVRPPRPEPAGREVRSGRQSHPPEAIPTATLPPPAVIPGAEPGRSPGSEDEDEILSWLGSVVTSPAPKVDLPAPGASRSEPERRPCRSCGHPMLVGGVRCARCGETYSRRAEGLLPVFTAPDGSPTSIWDAPTSIWNKRLRDRLTTVDWFVAFLLPDVCFILGIIRVIRRRPAGGKLIGAAVGFFFLRLFLAVLFFASQPAGPP